MIDILLIIIGVWGLVFFESAVLAFSAVSLYLIFFFVQVERIPVWKVVVIYLVVGVAIDSLTYIPLGSHLFIVGGVYLLSRGLKRILDGASGMSGILVNVISFWAYYISIGVITYWSQDRITLNFVYWEFVLSPIITASISVGIMYLVRFLLSSTLNSSERRIQLRS